MRKILSHAISSFSVGSDAVQIAGLVRWLKTLVQRKTDSKFCLPNWFIVIFIFFLFLNVLNWFFDAFALQSSFPSFFYSKWYIVNIVFFLQWPTTNTSPEICFLCVWTGAKERWDLKSLRPKVLSCKSMDPEKACKIHWWWKFWLPWTEVEINRYVLSFLSCYLT